MRAKTKAAISSHPATRRDWHPVEGGSSSDARVPSIPEQVFSLTGLGSTRIT